MSVRTFCNKGNIEKKMKFQWLEEQQSKSDNNAFCEMRDTDVLVED